MDTSKSYPMSRFLTGNLFRSWVLLEDYLISRLICSLRMRFWLHFPNDLCSIDVPDTRLLLHS